MAFIPIFSDLKPQGLNVSCFMEPSFYFFFLADRSCCCRNHTSFHEHTLLCDCPTNYNRQYRWHLNKSIAVQVQCLCLFFTDQTSHYRTAAMIKVCNFPHRLVLICTEIVISNKYFDRKSGIIFAEK
jgi:hypothetical protein